MREYLYKIVNPAWFIPVNGVGNIYEEKLFYETKDKKEALALFIKHWGYKDIYSCESFPGVKMLFPEELLEYDMDALLEEDNCWHWSGSFQNGRWNL